MINLKDFTIQVYDLNPYLQELDSLILDINENLVFLDESIFYPLGGGQPGDTGKIILPDGHSISVIDTLRDISNPNKIWIKLDEKIEKSWQGKVVKTFIDWDRRYRHMQMHTCMHLLCSLIDAPVTGCSISESKARLDFDLPEPSINKEDITNSLNDLINQEIQVKSKLIRYNELNKNIIKTENIFPPNYNGNLRIVEIEGIDIQPCGGTHVLNTKEIKKIICTKIKKVSKFNRRIEIEFNNTRL